MDDHTHNTSSHHHDEPYKGEFPSLGSLKSLKYYRPESPRHDHSSPTSRVDGHHSRRSHRHRSRRRRSRKSKQHHENRLKDLGPYPRKVMVVYVKNKAVHDHASENATLDCTEHGTHREGDTNSKSHRPVLVEDCLCEDCRRSKNLTAQGHAQRVEPQNDLCSSCEAELRQAEKDYRQWAMIFGPERLTIRKPGEESPATESNKTDQVFIFDKNSADIANSKESAEVTSKNLKEPTVSAEREEHDLQNDLLVDRDMKRKHVQIDEVSEGGVHSISSKNAKKINDLKTNEFIGYMFMLYVVSFGFPAGVTVASYFFLVADYMQENATALTITAGVMYGIMIPTILLLYFWDNLRSRCFFGYSIFAIVVICRMVAHVILTEHWKTLALTAFDGTVTALSFALITVSRTNLTLRLKTAIILCASTIFVHIVLVAVLLISLKFTNGIPDFALHAVIGTTTAHFFIAGALLEAAYICGKYLEEYENDELYAITCYYCHFLILPITAILIFRLFMCLAGRCKAKTKASQLHENE